MNNIFQTAVCPELGGQSSPYCGKQLIFLPLKLSVKTTPCFRYEGETGEERNLVIFKDTSMNNHIKGELSTRPFH